MLDREKRYRVERWDGVAFYYYGDEMGWTEENWTWDGEGDPDDEASYIYDEPEEVPTGNVIMVMVGDDEKHIIDPEECTELDDDEFCTECGQIGCKGDRIGW